jgi:hypothetical protein
MKSEELLPCATPDCKSTPSDITPKAAHAIAEYQLRYNPKFTLNLECDVCGRRSRYPDEKILAFLPLKNRPKPLPADYFWAFILIELDSYKSAENHAYLGDRVLVQRLLSEPNGTWYGTLKSTSPYAPTLKIENYIKGAQQGSYAVCLAVMEGETPKPIPKPDPIPRSSSFAMFLSPKNNEQELTCANVFCSNPSCSFIYSTMTFKKFKKMAKRDIEYAHLYDKHTLPIVKLECDVCGIARIIDARSFDELYKER